MDVPGSGFAFAMYALAESIGLGRDDYEVVALGSTPKRLQALLAGECAATMLNAGNELHAEAAGYRPLATVSRTSARPTSAPCWPWSATSAGAGRPLAAALARDRGGHRRRQARRPRRSPRPRPPSGCRRRWPSATWPGSRTRPRGWSRTASSIPASIRTMLDLRRRYRPETDDGTDVFAPALAAGSGLLASRG